MDRGLLEYGDPTERQKEIFEAVEKYGSNIAAAEALGISRGTVKSAIKRIKQKAASRGYAPAYNMTKTAPDGFVVGQTWTRYNADGEIERQTVHTKAEREKEAAAFLEAVRELAEPYRGASPKVAAPKRTIEDALAVIGIGDMHIGMLGWAHELDGDPFDLRICEDLYRAAFERAVSIAPAAKNALIIAVGDNFHMNSSDWLTPKSGHRLDGDSRFQKVITVGARVLRYAVEAAIQKHHHVTLIVELGNHDFDSSAGLALALSMYFENNPRVSIDTTPGRFHYYRFGKCFIGVTHGDTAKPPKLPLLMATRRPKDWGETVHRKWYTGHLHTEILRDYGGAVVETLATLSPKDAYAHEHGYDSTRKMIIDIWDKEHGRESRHEIGVSRL